MTVPRRIHSVARYLAGLVAVAAVPMAGYSGYAALAGPTLEGATPATRVYFLLLAVTGLVAAALAAVVAFRSRPGRDTATFAVFLAGVSLAAMDEGRFRLLERLLGDAVPGLDGWLSALFLAAMAAGAAASVRIPQLFPRPLEPATIRAAGGPRWLRTLQARLVGPGPAWLGFGLAGWLLLVATHRWLSELLLPLLLVYLLTELGVAILYFRVGWATGDEEDRRRIFWFLEAGLIAAASLAVGLVVEVAVHGLGAAGPVVAWLHALVIPAGMLVTFGVLGFAILYRGALDPRLVVRRTLVYSAVGFVLTALFVGVETLVETLLADRLGLPPAAGAYAAGILAALVFGPVRGAIEKRLPG